MVELKEKPIERFMLKVRTLQKKMHSTLVNRARFVPVNNVRLGYADMHLRGSG